MKYIKRLWFVIVAFVGCLSFVPIYGFWILTAETVKGTNDDMSWNPFKGIK